MEPEASDGRPPPMDNTAGSRWTKRLRCPVTVANISVLCALFCILCPTVANYAFFVYRLVFGTLYPAYASYKAVRSRDVREYVKWMMYWIVFALFTCGETITDVFLSFWFPFYYEIKIGFVLWLLSPATKGSSILYRKFVHPMLTNREQEIDEYIARAKEQGYHTVLHLGSKGVNYATNVIMQTAIKSVEVAYKGGGGLVNQLRKSYSLSDLTEGEGEPVRDINRNGKDVDGIEYRGNRRPDRVDGPRSSNRARGYSPRRSASGSARMEMYFPEVDLDVRQRRGSSRSREASVPLSHIRSSEDVSSGYTSSDHFYEDAQMELDTGTSEDCASIASSEGPLVRTASVGSTRSTRTKGSASTRSSTASTTTTATKKATQGEMDESSSEEEDLWSDPLDNYSPPIDRTLFVNDLNLFPIHETKVEVAIVSSSTELIHIPSSDTDNANSNTNSLPNLQEEDEKVSKSVPVDNQVEMNEVSSSNKLNESNKDSKTVNAIPQEKLSSDLSLGNQSDQNTSPECMLSDESSSETLRAFTEKLDTEEKTTEKNMQKILSEVAEDSQKSEIPSESHSITLLADTIASDENIKESTCAVASSVNAANTDFDSTSKEAGDISIDDSLFSLESITDPAIAAPVTIEQTKCFVLGDIAMDTDGVSKEEHSSDSRGGKYNKRPAPVPPKQEDGSKGLNQEKDGDALHARLVLKRGVVRSLPDVGLALSDSPLIKSEVFMSLGTTKHSPPIPSPRTKHDNKEKFLDGKDSSKNRPDAGIGLPHFLNLSRHPHFGSLTSIFPFWQGAHSSSSDTQSVVTSGKLDESISKSRKCAEGNMASNVTPLKNVGSEDKTNDKSQAGDTNTSAARGRDESKKNFPVRQLSQSPSRTKRRF